MPIIGSGDSLDIRTAHWGTLQQFNRLRRLCVSAWLLLALALGSGLGQAIWRTYLLPIATFEVISAAVWLWCRLTPKSVPLLRFTPALTSISRSCSGPSAPSW